MSADDHLGLQFSVTHPDELGSYHWAHQNEAVVGHAFTTHIPGESVELAALRVNDEHQGHGIGHKLVDHVIDHYPGQNITLSPSPFGNEPMNRDQLKHFYGSHGFRAKGQGMIRRSR